MAEMMLTKTRILGGVWEGALTTDDPTPAVEVMFLNERLEGASLVPIQGEIGLWSLKIPVPPQLLADGVQTFVIADAKTGERLDTFTIVTGEPLENDIRAEVDLLRAELDMLKRAFRRHCTETM